MIRVVFLAFLALVAPAAALDRGPPAQRTGPITITGSGSTGDVSGMSVMLPNAGNALRTIVDKLGDYPISVTDFGNSLLLRSCGVNAGAAFQAASDKIVSLGGGTLLVPKGIFCVGPTEEVAVNGPVDWLGEGRGVNSGTGYTGGTLVRTSNPTGNIFTVKSRGGAKFRNFAIDGYGVAGGKTAGAAISISGDAVTDYASGSEITGMAFGGGLYDAIRAPSSINWSITNNNITDFNGRGIYLSCESGSNPDGSTGHLTIANNLIWAFNTQATATAGIQYQCGGDVRVIGNKILGAQRGIYLYLTRGPTGTLEIVGNSIEEQTIYQIRGERAPGVASSVTFGNLLINSNQLSILATGGTASPFLGSISLADSPGSATTPWLTNVTMNSNVFNHGIPKAVPFISIQGGRGVTAANNVMTNLGNGGAWGFDVGGSATKVSLNQNEGHDIPAGMYNTVGTAATIIDTINKPTVGTVPVVANGSQIYFSDGLQGSAPLVGSSTGTLATVLDSAWRSSDPGKWLAYTSAIGATSGTITTLGTTTASRQTSGKTTTFAVDATITTNGTASGNLTITMPNAPASSGSFVGKEIAVTAKPFICSFTSGNSTMYCVNVADGSYPGANGARFVLNGTYQSQ